VLSYARLFSKASFGVAIATQNENLRHDEILIK